MSDAAVESSTANPSTSLEMKKLHSHCAAVDFPPMRDTVALCKWLKDKSEVFDGDWEASFLDARIDGNCFLLVTEEHLKNMQPLAKLGDVLKLLRLKTLLRKHARMLYRNKVIVEGSAFMEPACLKAKFCVTNSYVKFMYDQDVTFQNGNTRTITKKHFVDNIDLSTVVDVDLKTENITEITTEPGCCGFSSRTFRSERVETRVYLALERVGNSNGDKIPDGSHALRSPYVCLGFPTEEEGKNLQSLLIDLLEEVQLEDARGDIDAY